MIAFVYTRTLPNDSRVAKPDRKAAQEKRCKDFLAEHDIRCLRTYSDEGEMHEACLLPQMQKLLYDLKYIEENKVFVIADHRGRLGTSIEVQEFIIRSINNAGGQFICPHANLRLSRFSKNFIESLKGI